MATLILYCGALPPPGRDFDAKFAYWNETKTKMSADTGVVEVYDVVVVGAGVEGSATAYHLASHLPRKKILLLEQFSAVHSRGSSHGCSRITRRAYEESFYVLMMREAYKLWAQLEREAGKQLYIPTGILVFAPSESLDFDATVASLKVNGEEHEVLTAEEVNSKYSEQLQLPADYKCVFEKDGGVLLANNAVAAYQQLYLERGGTLLEKHKVTEIQPGDIISIVTNQGTFQTKKLVLTAGAWTQELIKALDLELPFQVIRTEVHYWMAEKPEAFSASNFPTVKAECPVHGAEDLRFYGLPIHEYPGLLKLFYHSGPPVHPDHRDANPKPVTTEFVSSFIRKCFKGVSDTPSIYESCMYTMSPDENPVLDLHPDHRNIIIGAGFSGHGFKLSPVVGKILCELALDLPPSYDLTPFRVDRFTPSKAAY